MPVFCDASSVSAVFVLLTYYTDALPCAKNIDRLIPLHTPFTFFIRCRPTSAPVCVSQLIGRVFTSFVLCSHCLFLNGVHLVWAHVVVDVITLMHVRFVWAALIVRHMGLSNWFWVVAMFGLGLLCISHAHTFYTQDVVRPRILSTQV